MAFECQNCGKTWEESDLKEAQDLLLRLEPGDVVPVGACPDCGAFCHEVKAFVFSNNDGTESIEVEEVNEAYAALLAIRQLGWAAREVA